MHTYVSNSQGTNRVYYRVNSSIGSIQETSWHSEIVLHAYGVHVQHYFAVGYLYNSYS